MYEQWHNLSSNEALLALDSRRSGLAAAFLLVRKPAKSCSPGSLPSGNGNHWVKMPLELTDYKLLKERNSLTVRNTWITLMGSGGGKSGKRQGR